MILTKNNNGVNNILKYKILDIYKKKENKIMNILLIVDFI